MLPQPGQEALLASAVSGSVAGCCLWSRDKLSAMRQIRVRIRHSSIRPVPGLRCF